MGKLVYYPSGIHTQRSEAASVRLKLVNESFMRLIVDGIKRAALNALNRDRHIDDLKINQGRILSYQQRSITSKTLSDFEFCVFSQWGEDGILQFLTRNLPVQSRTFIEFGVEDFFESNCRFLLMKDLWQGFVIDGSEAHIARLQSSYFYWKYQLRSKAAFITRENIASLLEESGFDKEVGIMSVDLDGNDYHVLERLPEWRPAILVLEYNAVFGGTRAVSVPYDPAFRRQQKHYSNLYYGASLPAFCHLTAQRGYGLVGVNSMGTNAFFVRRDLLNDIVCEIDPKLGYRDSVPRESRDSRGRLSMLSGADRLSAIAGLPLVDVVTGEILSTSSLKS